jgi:hypothetical protein
MAIRTRIQLFVTKLKQLFRKEPPADPYAYVMAPKKPRSPYRSSAAVAELDE